MASHPQAPERAKTRRYAPVIGSLLAHGAVIALVAQLSFDRADTRAPEHVTIEIVAPEPGRADDPTQTERAPGEGGEPAGAARATPDTNPPAAARATPDTNPPARPRTNRVARPAPTTPEPSWAHDDAPAKPVTLAAAADLAALSGLPVSGIGLSASGIGLGGPGAGLGGSGGGRGRGARGAGPPRKPAAARASKPRSRARPPRLIYPTRDRPIREDALFIVLLTIDEDGYVDGVRLIKGVNRHQDEKALAAVWRFRYAPALDETGRPISVKIEQEFMLD